MTTRGRKPRPGRITFVGAGPGDPGLLTTRAATVLANAPLVPTLEIQEHWRGQALDMEQGGVSGVDGLLFTVEIPLSHHETCPRLINVRSEDRDSQDLLYT